MTAYAYCGLVLCAFLIIIDGSTGNIILGKFDASTNSEYSSETSKNDDAMKFESSKAFKRYISWEVKPDKTCVKRVIVEMNGIETENSETPIDCTLARKEVFEFQEKARKELAEQVRKMKKEQEEIRKAHAKFAEDIQKELSSLRSGFKF